MREGTEPEGLVGHVRESGLYPWGRGMPMDVSQELEQREVKDLESWGLNPGPTT